MKSEKGITLVALILIIVLWLVLAAVTVALVLSNETEAPAVEPGTSVVDQTPVVDETVTDENDIENTVEDDTTPVVDEVPAA